MEYIPLPQEHIVASVRGFFTARMLGLLKMDEHKVSIKTPSGETALFPDPMLSAFTSTKDLLPALLESLPLAMAEVQRIGTVEPLSPYAALRDYGWQTSEHRTSQILEYERPATVLAKWIETGEIDGLVPVIAPLRNLASADERRDAIAQFLLGTEATYDELYSAYRQDIDITRRKTSQTPDWPGIFPAIRTALRQLAGAVRESPTESFDDESM